MGPLTADSISLHATLGIMNPTLSDLQVSLVAPETENGDRTW